MADRFGDMLRHWRLARSLTQRQVAAAMLVTPTYVSLLEKGRSRAPTAERCRQLAAVLGVAEQVIIRASLQERDPAVTEILQESRPSGAAAVPVFLWGRSRLPRFSEEGTPDGTSARTITVDGILDAQAFALELLDDVLEDWEPELRRGQVLVFSPRAEVKNGDPALIRGQTTLWVGRVRFLPAGPILIRGLDSGKCERTILKEELAGLCRLVRRIEHYERPTSK